MITQLIRDGIKYYKHNKWDREEILKYSEKKFRCTLKHAYNHSSFYKNYYTWKGIKYEDLDYIPIEQIPPITKEQVRNNFYKIATKPLNADTVNKAMKGSNLLPKVGSNYIVHTSGSTGIPTAFLYDSHALDILESNFVRLSIGGDHGVELKDFPIKSLYIAPVGSGYACTALAMYGMNKYHCKSIIVNAQTPLNQWGNMIKDYNPCYLSGYPSCLNIVASLVESGDINICPKKIITGGEPLNKEGALYYKKVFKADVINYYGCTESILVGAGTTYYDGMYLFDDLNYLETDKQNRLIITPLYNKTFPLIRYQLTDVVDSLDKTGFRSLPYTYINKIIGRDEDLMWFINEDRQKDFLHPLFIDDLNVKGIVKYQFNQISETYFELYCVSLKNDLKLQHQRIKRQIDTFLSNKKMMNVNYTIKFVDDIPIDEKTGKSKLVTHTPKTHF